MTEDCDSVIVRSVLSKASSTINLTFADQLLAQAQQAIARVRHDSAVVS